MDHPKHAGTLFFKHPIPLKDLGETILTTP
jgi:hypothetical protein